MSHKFFSSAKRAPHLGPYPLERLERQSHVDLSDVPQVAEIHFDRPDEPLSIVNAMSDHQATLDALRDGLVNKTRSEIPDDLAARANHLKAFGYFCDSAMVGVGALDNKALLAQPRRNPDIDQLASKLDVGQVKTLATGIEETLADLRDNMAAAPSSVAAHQHVIVFLYSMPRDPKRNERGCDWIQDAQAQRTCLLSSETAVVIANYIRLLGWDAKAHTQTSADIDLNMAAVCAGLSVVENGRLVTPFLGDRFGVAAVSTDMPMRNDDPLAPMSRQAGASSNSIKWRLGVGTGTSAANQDPFAKRAFADGPHPFETLKRVDTPTTYIDEPNVPRVPKRTDMFARAQFGDLGPAVQKATEGGRYVRKSAPSSAQRRVLAAMTLFQDGPHAEVQTQSTRQSNADNIKGASYFLGIDAVGLSRCPDWAWYSHDANGDPIDPPHDQAISMIVDQGFETMEGASGDDWISVAQSMRAYLRFSVLGGVLASHLRALGYKAKAHTVMDGEVLQPPLLLLSGLGEVSRIGEVILNPFLGPRLKSGVITTDMPMEHDRPIDFGLQRFCESCNKCARECPSGAITAGPKRMFNGYEIWKSDSQKCATYRITTEGGAMCGRCMKTCPWNLEGLFAEKPFRWAAMNIPKAAPALAKLDDALGRGDLRPIKKWWWDITLAEDGGYRPVRGPVNARRLQPDLKIDHKDQTLAVYPAPLAPPPWPYPFAMDREAGVRAYGEMLDAEDYKKQRKDTANENGVHRYAVSKDSPVVAAEVTHMEKLSDRVTLYEFAACDGSALPTWQAGAHVDVVVAPDKLRQYSLCSDPADTSRYQIAVLKEPDGAGGSMLLHRIFKPGRKVFISKPINHFPLDEAALHSFLMGGGIGVTPMIAMAHRLHAIGASFELHYSVSKEADAAFEDILENAPWADRVHLHVSEKGARVALDTLFSPPHEGAHIYACGPEDYMAAVMVAAGNAGYPDEACHVEYFTRPETPEYENAPFDIVLRDGRQIHVREDQSAADALLENGVQVDLKCSDGLCGVCKCGVTKGRIEHRDFVLTAAQRDANMILCQSRAAKDETTLFLDL